MAASPPCLGDSIVSKMTGSRVDSICEKWSIMADKPSEGAANGTRSARDGKLTEPKLSEGGLHRPISGLGTSSSGHRGGSARGFAAVVGSHRSETI